MNGSWTNTMLTFRLVSGLCYSHSFQEASLKHKNKKTKNKEQQVP